MLPLPFRCRWCLLLDLGILGLCTPQDKTPGSFQRGTVSSPVTDLVAGSPGANSLCSGSTVTFKHLNHPFRTAHALLNKHRSWVCVREPEVVQGLHTLRAVLSAESGLRKTPTSHTWVQELAHLVCQPAGRGSPWPSSQRPERSPQGTPPSFGEIPV